MKYRKLNSSEIEMLVARRCSADDWINIEVAESFEADSIYNVHFSGENRLGYFEKVFSLENGQQLQAGISNAVIHNCIIGNNVYIANIGNVIANYDIDDDCYITSVNTLSCTPGTTFGNGVIASPVNENGGRAIPIFDRLSAQLAHILVYYRHRKDFLSYTFDKIKMYAEEQKSLRRGYIGKCTKITDCNTIINIRTSSGCTLHGVSSLSNGTIGTNAFVGSGVVAKDFICGADTTIDEGASIERCFVGEGCIIDKGFSAVDTLIFANCEFANGEAASVFAAPYTVSHHKSSLVIACGLSFANIGSGTNMSNHAYRLGAVHQSIAGRGCKFGSNSYLLSPTHIGEYTMILGSHKNHPDTHEFPFSYLVEEDGMSILIPAVNLFRLGTLRDVYKWQKRDRRRGIGKLDNISYDLLTPFVVKKITKAIAILQELQTRNPEATHYDYKNGRIQAHSLKKAIVYYNEAITVFVGDYLIRRHTTDKATPLEDSYNEWLDLAGLIAPKRIVEEWLDNPATIANNDFGIALFGQVKDNYHKYVDSYIAHTYDCNDRAKNISLLEKYISILETLRRRLHKEAATEFYGDSRIGYGIDFDDKQNDDFDAVAGQVDENAFLKETLTDIEHKIEIAKGICRKE